MRLLVGALALQVGGWRLGSGPASGQPAAVLARSDPHEEHGSSGHGSSGHGSSGGHEAPREKDLVNYESGGHDAHSDSHGSHSDSHESHSDAHGSHGSHAEAHGYEGSSAASVAIGLFSTTILIPFVFTLIQQGGVVTELMWQFIDMFISVFLAILWFGAFSEVLTLDSVLAFLRIGPIVVAVCQVIVLYFLALSIAYYLRDNMSRLV